MKDLRKCPFCGSLNTEILEDIDFSLIHLSRRLKCAVCGEEFTENFEVHYTGFSCIKDGEFISEYLR